MRKATVYLIMFGCIAFVGPAPASTQAGEVLRAVVKIRATIPEGARTAAVLGTEREGHGIIFDSKGHILTAGYLIIGPEGELLGVGSLFTQLTVPGLGLLPCNVFIPIDLLKPILDDLISTGRSKQPARPWLGVNAEEAHQRVFITRITEGGPAEEAGLQADDLILTVNGKPVSGLSDFYRKVWETGSAGAEITLGILKGVEVREISLRTGDRNRFLLMKPRKTL